MPTNASNAATRESVLAEDDPIRIADIHQAAPFWLLSTDATYRYIRQGLLRSIAIGRRRYVTIRLLRECLARHTVGVAA